MKITNKILIPSLNRTARYLFERTQKAIIHQTVNKYILFIQAVMRECAIYYKKKYLRSDNIFGGMNIFSFT